MKPYKTLADEKTEEALPVNTIHLRDNARESSAPVSPQDISKLNTPLPLGMSWEPESCLRCHL